MIERKILVMERNAKMIEIKNLVKKYDNTTILNRLNMTIHSGDYIAITGPSGSGKSTLLYCVSGMDVFDEGKVFFKNKDISMMTEKELSQFRLNNMGFVFQNPQMLKNLSIMDNIMLPGLVAGKESAMKVKQHAHFLMSKMGIEEIANRDIHEVSGGQLQRAAICRAMINHPDVLFMDEPTGALNREATKEVLKILEELNQEGMTIIVVTHDEQVAQSAKSQIRYGSIAGFGAQ